MGTCSADLGDTRCKIDLADAAFRGTGMVVALDATSTFTASGLDSFEDGWFTAGKLLFTSGANVGLGVEVKTHRKSGIVTLDLWQALPDAIEAGDGFIGTPGCAKRFQTCHDRVNNV